MFDDLFDDLLGLIDDNNVESINGVCADTFEIPVDLDGDGTVDNIMEGYGIDSDGDGIIDHIALDYNGDGVMEMTTEIHGIDSDGDGIIDRLDVDLDGNDSVDMVLHMDGNGKIDNVEINSDLFHNLDGYSHIAQNETNQDTYEVPAEFDIYENFDPENYQPETTVGHPEDAIDHWHLQTGNSCAVCAQEFIYEQLTGREISQEEMEDIGEALGVYDGNGTAINDIGKILEYQGFSVDRSTGNTIDDIEEGLDNGAGIIAVIDSDEIWQLRDNDWGIFGHNEPDHAVQVIGIDRSDPNNPLVILNDSGHYDGCGSMIPLDIFIDAWEDSGCFMAEVH